MKAIDTYLVWEKGLRVTNSGLNSNLFTLDVNLRSNMLNIPEQIITLDQNALKVTVFGKLWIKRNESS